MKNSAGALLKGGEKMKRRTEDSIREVLTFHYPNATVRVYFPDISDEEHERRMKRIHDAAAELLKEAWRVERMKAKQKESAE